MHTLQVVAGWLYDNAPGILSAVGAFMAWQKSRQNGKQIADVHEAIAVNRETDHAQQAAATIAAAEKRAAHRGRHG